MVKESGRDGSLKKKRKSATSADNETDVDIYKVRIKRSGLEPLFNVITCRNRSNSKRKKR
jgi:hypothetical protein